MVDPNYADRLECFIRDFFKKEVNRKDLEEWLEPIDEFVKSEEILYPAADYLGIDRLTPKFNQTELEYSKFREKLRRKT